MQTEPIGQRRIFIVAARVGEVYGKRQIYQIADSEIHIPVEEITCLVGIVRCAVGVIASAACRNATAHLQPVFLAKIIFYAV